MPMTKRRSTEIVRYAVPAIVVGALVGGAAIGAQVVRGNGGVEIGKSVV